jgi:hypothetical protein
MAQAARMKIIVSKFKVDEWMDGLSVLDAPLKLDMHVHNERQVNLAKH